MVGFSFIFKISRFSKFSRISRKWTFLKRPLFQETPFSEPERVVWDWQERGGGGNGRQWTGPLTLHLFGDRTQHELPVSAPAPDHWKGGEERRGGGGGGRGASSREFLGTTISCRHVDCPCPISGQHSFFGKLHCKWCKLIFLNRDSFGFLKRSLKRHSARPETCFLVSCLDYNLRFPNRINSVQTRRIVKARLREVHFSGDFLGIFDFLRIACSLGIHKKTFKFNKIPDFNKHPL